MVSQGWREGRRRKRNFEVENILLLEKLSLGRYLLPYLLIRKLSEHVCNL